MNQIAKALAVSRSNLYERKDERTEKRPATYVKPDLKDICHKKPSYGYRRVSAMLNRKLILKGLRRVNHKRIYRIMRDNDLLLRRYTGKPTRTHEGKVVTLKSNMRWCADTFTIKCFNGEKVEISFCLDTCDREIISYVATKQSTDGELIRDLMTYAFEKRFENASHLPHPIEWLSDNGPPYTARDTRKYGANLGFIMCNTPSYSPQSNEASEAFVKTFKRDYVYLNDVESAEKVLAQLRNWFEDYNENASVIAGATPRSCYRTTKTRH